MKIFNIRVLVCLLFAIHKPIVCILSFNFDRNISDVAIALSQIINGLNPTQLSILAASARHQGLNYTVSPLQSEYDNYDSNMNSHVDYFMYQLHKLYFKSVIFYDVELFFEFIEANLQGSIESVNLIFCQPYELSQRIQERKLSHRLSLFIFFWGAKYPPKPSEVRFEEPIRAVVITRPRRKAFRIYYNQAVPHGDSNLRLVNWYDSDNLGLQRVPLLPNAASVYSNFHGRVFRVPVFHSPPWFWVNYDNESNNVTTMEEYVSASSFAQDDVDYTEVNVTGGRDHRLLSLLAERMNFQFVYIEAPGRTQGTLRSDGEENETFTGGIGLLQNGLADFLLGDVSISWERCKAVEFSFFTLADSGAFATHAPRRLNEALAIVRPFKLDVWPYLLLTIIFSGPIFYGIIAIPYKWQLRKCVKQHDVEKLGELRFHMTYIKEITININTTRKLIKLQQCQSDSKLVVQKQIPPQLFDRCIWFTVQLFLKQSCQELYHGCRAKFLMIVYWIAATYVLADVYSAQLTSQFARPAHEPPMNTLLRLQKAMLEQSYQLFVEKDSSSLEMLENGTEIFRSLHALMKRQNQDVEGYLIDSVESGLKLIGDGLENKVLLGGRETLYFNIQQFGSKNFQLSHKLYTRYSAVAVQIGCPFLDSLNDVLIHLFEGGILDKMTSAEYSTQSLIIGKQINEKQNNGENTAADKSTDSNSNDKGNESNGKSAEQFTKMQKVSDTQAIQPLNLRMLQGAFFVLLFGYAMASFILVLEICCNRISFDFMKDWKSKARKQYRVLSRHLHRVVRAAVVRVLR